MARSLKIYFLYRSIKKTSIPLTNNEAERCIRGFVIQRKI
ncbi:transposase, partial [uncultured Vibrio sp.]